MDSPFLIQILGLSQFLNAGLYFFFGLIVLFTRRPWPWAVLCFGMSAQAATNVMYHVFATQSLDYFYFVSFLYGPCTLLAIQLTLTERQPTVNTCFAHLLPIIFLMVLKALNLVSWSLVIFVMIPQNYGYLLVSWRRLVDYRKSYEVMRSAGVPKSYVWLQVWVMSLIVVGLGQAARTAIGLNQPVSLLLGIVLNVLFTIYLAVFLIFYGLIESNIGRRLTREEESEAELLRQSEPSAVADTDSAVLARVQEKIDQLFAVEKIYLLEDLSIHDLAGKVGYPARKLSSLIASVHHCNFPELINRYRVAEAQRLIRDPAFSGMNLTDLGMQAGFNSRASFNLMFKRLAGMTPREYRKQVLTEAEKNSADGVLCNEGSVIQ